VVNHTPTLSAVDALETSPRRSTQTLTHYPSVPRDFDNVHNAAVESHATRSRRRWTHSDPLSACWQKPR